MNFKSDFEIPYLVIATQNLFSGHVMPTIKTQLGVLLSCGLLSAGFALADSEPQPDAPRIPRVSHWNDLSGELSFTGVTFSISYTADFLTNAYGGVNTEGAFQYNGLFDFAIALDTETLGWWNHGTFFANFVANHGIELSARHIGDLQVANNNEAPDAARLYEFWYEHRFFDEHVRLKFGKFDVNSDFDGGVYRDEFMHSSPGFSPTIPMITYPDTALGVVLFVEPIEWFYAGAGIYDGEGTSNRTGFDTAFDPPGDSFTIVELGFRPSLTLFGQTDLPGQYSFGGFYHGGEWQIYFNDLDGRLPARSETGNHGVYVAFDQLVYRESNDPNDEQGMGVFFQFGWSPSDHNEIHKHYGGGFQYYGLLPTRDDDVCGLGLHHVTVSTQLNELEDRFSETAIELFYRAEVTDWLCVKPDLQYIANPGGDGQDALVAGVRLEFSL